ncbi:hypothetical protein CMI37_15045 [Candidatus Pacearchaeota archaeon]|nr:hypothetical protein [Candidatus Pacearchaeota archaeon]|tara:strand:- start:723 stop:989 length:267 start_codon:yes stop_codon:yes gene_type:complete
MKTNEIKKGMKIQTNQLGMLVNGEMLDNKKGNIRMISTKGTEAGFFDSMGSVYAYQIILVEVDGEWIRVEHTDKQLKLKQTVDVLYAG